jgi:hypothetical protein
MKPTSRCRSGAQLPRHEATRDARPFAVTAVSFHFRKPADEQAYRTQMRPNSATWSVSVLHVTDCPRRLPAATSAETRPLRSNTIRFRWMLAGCTPIRSASSSAVRACSEVCRRISVRTLLPMVSIATSTSFGMSPGIDRRGITVIVPDKTPVALSARGCQYQDLKDANRTDRGRHPMGARAPHPRRGVSEGCPSPSLWPLTQSPASPTVACRQVQPDAASRAPEARGNQIPRGSRRAWRSTR